MQSHLEGPSGMSLAEFEDGLAPLVSECPSGMSLAGFEDGLAPLVSECIMIHVLQNGI